MESALYAIAEALSRQADSAERNVELLEEQAEFMKAQLRVSAQLEQRLILQNSQDQRQDA